MVFLRGIEGAVGSIFVTIGFLERVGLIELRDVGLAISAWSALTGKIAERYCVPISGPCRLSSVGSWATEKKICSSVRS